MKITDVYPNASHLILKEAIVQLGSQGLFWIRNEMNTLKYECKINSDLP